MSETLSRSKLLRAANQFATSSEHEFNAIGKFYESLNTPKSLAAKILFSYGEHDQLLELETRKPETYSSAEEYHLDYLAVKFLSKYNGLKTTYDKKDRALQKFFKTEERCKQTNQRFSTYGKQESNPYAHLISQMRNKIANILGEFNIEEFFEKSSWGPGVSTFIKGSNTSAARKFQEEIGITRSAYSLLGASLGAAYPHWFRSEHVSDSLVQFVGGNTVTTVPKNSKEDRVIAVEPGINLYFQKGVGSMLKSRLRRVGVDLRTQKVNQVLSAFAERLGLATVDFSSASDCFAWKVIEMLLPPRWFLVLDSIRSRDGLIDGKYQKWEKFSSMGNGFTFELETLIFYVAALVACEQTDSPTNNVSVFGDDVIIPSSAFDLFHELAHELGFKINLDKTFTSGPFRESCGSHYFHGFDVKPIFHKEKFKNAFSLYKLANSIRRLSHRRGFNRSCDRRFLGTWRHIYHGLPSALRSVRIPEGYGDGGLISNWDEACPSRATDGHDGWVVKTLLETVERSTCEYIGLLNERLCQTQGGLELKFKDHRTNALYAQSKAILELGYGNDVVLKDRMKLRVSDTFIPTWYNLGEWA